MSGVSGPNGDGTLKIAVFDVDRTLLVGTSAEELLARALRRDKMLSLCRVFSGLWQMIKHLHLGWEAAVYYKSYYIRGLKEQEVLARLPAVMDRAVMPRLSPMLLAFIPYLRKAGYQIYIVSGTLNAIVAELVQRLSADGGSGSVLESVKGIYTGMIADIHPYHYGKTAVLDRLLKGRTVDWSASFAFGDSWADVPLLSRFGHPVAVNPGVFMRRRAKRRGWLTIHDGLDGRDAMDLSALLERL